jgi:hypothetical protein
MAVNPITFLGSPVSLTITDDGTWRTLDVSAHIASGASGVLLRSRFSSATSNDNFALRKTGSTDNYIAAHPATPTYIYSMIGVDGSRQFDYQIEDGGAGACTLELMAYFDPTHVTFFTNAVTQSYSNATWTDFNIASATGGDTAIAAILYLHSTRSNSTEVGWRKNGSSAAILADAMGSTGGRYIGTTIVPCDASEIFEVYSASTFYGDFKCIGYIKSAYTGLDPNTDVSLGSTGAWTDITQTGALAQMIDVVANATGLQSGFRKNGDSSTTGYGILESGERYSALVECDASGIIEGQIDNTGVDFYLSGYFIAGSDNVSLTVDYGSAVGEASVINLAGTDAVVMTVEHGQAVAQGNDLPFILSNTSLDAAAVGEGSVVDLLTDNSFTLAVDYGGAVGSGESITFVFLDSEVVVAGQAVGQGSDIQLTTPFVLGASGGRRIRERAARRLMNFGR